MINYFKHNRDPSIKINTLTKFLENGNCIYQIIGKAEHDQNADSRLYNILRKYINDPTKISMINKTHAINSAKSCQNLKNSNKRMYFTSCIFCLSGKKCYNEKSNRTFNLKFKTKKGEKTIKVCYPDINKCRNRITLGMHIDFSFTYNGRYLDIIDVNPLQQNNNSNKNVITKDISKKLEINDFPELVSLSKSLPTKDINTTKKSNTSKSTLSDASKIIKEIDSSNSLPHSYVETKINDDNDGIVTAKDILCKNIDSDNQIDNKLNNEKKIAPKIIIPSELTKKLDFTINHLNKERDILRKTFIDLERETIDEILSFEEDLYNRYGRIVNDNDFTYSIS